MSGWNSVVEKIRFVLVDDSPVWVRVDHVSCVWADNDGVTHIGLVNGDDLTVARHADDVIRRITDDGKPKPPAPAP